MRGGKESLLAYVFALTLAKKPKYLLLLSVVQILVWIGRNLASYVQGRETELDVPEPVHHAEAGNPSYHEVRSFFGLKLNLACYLGWLREIFIIFLSFFT